MASLRFNVLPLTSRRRQARIRARLLQLAGAVVAVATMTGATMPPALALTRTEQTFTHWTVICVSDENTPKRCSMVQTLQRQQNQGFVLVWSISSGTGDNAKNFQEAVTVPAGVSIKEGVRLFIGDGDPLTIGYDVCGPRICLARMDLTNDMINAMKSAKKASASYVQASKQLVQVDLDLTGFTDAYNYLVKQMSS